MSAEEEIRQFVQRIERLREEVDHLNADVKEVYAEAKARGYDKTALGKVVMIRRARAKNPDAFEALDANVEMYLAAADGTPSRTHAYAREATPTQISPQPAASRSVQNEGERNQGLDQVAQKAEDHKPLSAGAAPAGVHAPDPSNFVTDTVAGEGVAVSVDPAPVPDDTSRRHPLDDDTWLRKRFPEKYQGATP